MKENKSIYRNLAEEIIASMINAKGFMAHEGHEDMTSISKGEKLALVMLSNVKGAISQKELTGMMCVAPSRLTAIVDSLEKKGYAKRKRSTDDKRVVNITITVAGRKSFDEFNEKMLGIFVKNLQKLGEADAKKFTKLLIKFLENSCEDSC
jgi:DNA-binding MarR family transcriptional regulator